MILVATVVALVELESPLGTRLHLVLAGLALLEHRPGLQLTLEGLVLLEVLDGLLGLITELVALEL